MSSSYSNKTINGATVSLILNIVVLFIIIIIGANRSQIKEYKIEQELVPEKQRITTPSIYVTNVISLGNWKKYTIKGNSSLIFRLESDYYPMWSSHQVQVTDDKGNIYTIAKGYIVSGESHPNTAYVNVTNTNSFDIVFKVGRCVDFKNCNIKFE